MMEEVYMGSGMEGNIEKVLRKYLSNVIQKPLLYSVILITLGKDTYFQCDQIWRFFGLWATF